jgi:glutamate carboxypeptidase
MELADDWLSSLYQEVGRSLSIQLDPRSTGGMSDGCWTATTGIPTIDGVGPEGGDDHSPDEYMDLASVPARAGTLAGTINEIAHKGEGK